MSHDAELFLACFASQSHQLSADFDPNSIRFRSDFVFIVATKIKICAIKSNVSTFIVPVYHIRETGTMSTMASINLIKFDGILIGSQIFRSLSSKVFFFLKICVGRQCLWQKRRRINASKNDCLN